MHGAFGRSSGELAYVVTGPPRDRRSSCAADSKQHTIGTSVLDAELHD
jgi:hypothetical protein